MKRCKTCRWFFNSDEYRWCSRWNRCADPEAICKSYTKQKKGG